jgi:hypothetical protein
MVADLKSVLQSHAHSSDSRVFVLRPVLTEHVFNLPAERAEYSGAVGVTGLDVRDGVLEETVGPARPQQYQWLVHAVLAADAAADEQCTGLRPR